MERRDFIKISAITGATAALNGCGQPDVQLIRFIPEEELTPGVATWKPSICTLCPAGCGTLVKVMEGDAEVVRNGKLGVMKMGLAKKIEGNPKHPISQGKLCPRGQAMLQVTYHPDRIKHPLKRTGPRGSGQFQEISWDEAIKELVSKLQELQAAKQEASLTFLTKPVRGQRRGLLERFLRAFGAPPPVLFEFFDETVLRRANALSFGRPQLPTFDFANSNYIISFGADFLGTWNSPVAQSIAYGQMRQGRPGQRGKFVMVEPRLSQTGANADEWVPTRPGTEGILVLGLAHVIIRDKLRPASAAGHAGSLIAGWSNGLPDYSPEAVEAKTGVAVPRITRLAHEMATHVPAVALAGGAALAHTNTLATALAVNALNALLGSVLKPGGVYFTFQATSGRESVFVNPEPRGSYYSLLNALGIPEVGTRRPIQALLLYDANPIFATPTGTLVQKTIEEIPFLASFGSFLDETSVLADLILPDHSPLESWLDDNPESGSRHTVKSLAPPTMRPLHNTRAMPDVLLEVARRIGGKLEAALPSESYDAMLRASFEGFLTGAGGKPVMDPEAFWKQAQEQGGIWADSAFVVHEARGLDQAPVEMAEPQFDAAPKEYPFHFLPFASPLLYDGSLAHLPWLQEAPDPLSTAMWGSWVEINPQTAERLGIRQGDLVQVESQHGKLQAPALVTPGIARDVVAMPAGQGHTNFTRYASGRGANPISILAPMVVPETGSLAWGATRVKVTRVGAGKLTLFGAELREHPHEHR